jgi:hypothetical protein
MRADIHDGSEHNTLQSEAGYIDARAPAAAHGAPRIGAIGAHIRQIDETPLQRAIGACALGLLYLGHPTLVVRVGTAGSCHEQT